MLLNWLKKKRRGSIIAVFLFAVAISIMSVGSLAVASTLYTSNEESAKNYADMQTYRTAAEIACYRYIMELQTVLVTQDTTASVLGSVGPTIYTESLELIQNKIGQTDKPLVWKTKTINEALAGTVLSDPTIIVNLLAKLGLRETVFELSIADYPTIDWTSGESFISKTEAQLRLEPLEVHVFLQVGSEVVKETLWVDGLRLLVDAERDPAVAGGSTTVTLKIVERDKGVQIYRD